MTKHLDPWQFQPGNQLWKLGNPGRPTIYPDADSLTEACICYFEWAVANPILEPRLTKDGQLVAVPKPRAMTQKAMALHLNISVRTWRNYKNSEKFAHVCEWADDICVTNNIDYAAANMLNPMFLARVMGLADRTEITGADGGPIRKTDVHEFSDEELAAIAAGGGEDVAAEETGED